jgi:hypothetical protein
MKCGSLNEGDEGRQTLDTKIYPVVSVDTRPPLVHVVEALKEYCFLVTKFFPELFLTCHKGLATEAHTKSLGHLDAAFTMELPTKKGVSSYPA